MNQQPVLTTHGLAIGYTAPRRPDIIIQADINVTLHAGEMVCLLGPNGVGKSTLMRTIGGMQEPLNGRVLLGGDDVYRLAGRELARRLSVVLTERPNTGLLSGYALTALGRHPYTGWNGNLSAEDEAVVRWAVAAVGAQDVAHRPVVEMSDGQQQKLMIARALAQEPDLMLLDEPTAFLDLPHRVEIMRLLRQLARDANRAILLSTHDLDLALRTADRIWLMSEQSGLQTGAPEDLVLSGVFEAAFRKDGVQFDAQTGSFRINTPAAGQVALVGEGLSALWTQRALEREGFQIANNGAVPTTRIEVIGQNGSTTWQTTVNGQTSEHHSLHEVVSHLQATN